MKLAGFTALSEEMQKCFRGGLAGSVFSGVWFTMTQIRNRRMALVRGAYYPQTENAASFKEHCILADHELAYLYAIRLSK